MRHPGVCWFASLVIVLACGSLPAATPQGAPATAMPRPLRFVLLPLDDRPVSLQYPQMLAPIAHAEILAPPVELLGRFTTPGDTDAIAGWLRAQEWSQVEGLIVSIDMLAYGGLVASRVHGVDQAAALARLSVLDEISRSHPHLRLYAFSTIMRLAPTADGVNEAYREQLSRWAEIAAGPRTPAEHREVAALVSAIPAAALDDYRRARARNRALNLASVRRVADGVLDFLVVSQDDARLRGVHLADRAAVRDAVTRAGLADRVGIQPGADEVAMLLLARAVLEARQQAPVVRVVYSSRRAPTMVAPFEDRPLHETAASQVVAAGATRASGKAAADLDLFVFVSRHDTGVPQRFAARIVAAVAGGARAIVADVDPLGDVQGGSPAFTEPLIGAGVFPKLYAYASWNTAGNTLGTAIPHGVLAWAGATLAARCTSPAWTRLAAAQATFLLHRLLNDYAYQGVLRPTLNAELRQAGRATSGLRVHARELADRLELALAPRLADYARPFTSRPYVLPAPAPTDVAVQVGPPRDLAVRLPWDRTFEAAITFDLPTAPLPAVRRQRPDCAPATPR